jgi:hypothetical protein
MGAPDQPRDKDGKWTAGASAGDHQASQSKPVAPGRQPHTPHKHAASGSPEAAQRKAEHDAGMSARLEAYAQAHGGQQAPNASGAAAAWRAPVTKHVQPSVGTSSGGGSGGGGSGGGGDRLSAAARDRIIRNKGIDARHFGQRGTPEDMSRARDLGMREPPNAAGFIMSALKRRR